jgi:protein involved in polysaccharide export with SLBB domain
MPYVGRDLNVGDRIKLSVTGSTPATSFVLQNAGVNYQASASTNVIVSVNGVVQSPGVAYQINGSTLDFLGVSVAAANLILL